MFKLTDNVLPRFSLIFITLSLAACGGGGGGGTTVVKDPAPDDGNDPIVEATTLKPGIFDTTISYDSGAAAQPALTLLSSSGRYALLTTKTQDGTFGTLTLSTNDTFSGNGTNVFLDETDKWQSVDGSLEGNAASLEEFTATFTADPAELDIGFGLTGTRSNQLSDLRVTMQDLYDTYTLSSSTQTTTVTIALDGKVTGSDTVAGSEPDKGCRIEGAIRIPDPAYNIFEGNLSFTNCANVPDGATSAQRNGDYPIIGFLQLSQQGTKELVFAGTNGQVRSVFIGQ